MPTRDTNEWVMRWRNQGEKIALGVCEWGQLNPELWARQAGGSLWRISYDVRDMWKDIVKQGGMGILDIIDITEPLYSFAGPGHWNDMDMLVVGLEGKGGPSSDLGGYWLYIYGVSNPNVYVVYVRLALGYESRYTQ